MFDARFAGEYAFGCEIEGDGGMFARFDSGSEMVSDLIPPHSAAVGMIGSICRFAGVQGAYVDIEILAVASCTRRGDAMPRLVRQTYNSFSVNRKMEGQINKGAALQMHEYVLECPCYQIFGVARNTHRRHPKYSNINSAHSFQDQFFRRLRRGTFYSIPSLGRKEFLATYVGFPRQTTEIQRNFHLVLPSMLYSCFDPDGNVQVVTKTNVEINGGLLCWRPNSVCQQSDGSLGFADPTLQAQFVRQINFKKKVQVA